MARLPQLHHAGLLHNLRFRYAKDNIYTYSGLFLIAINPYKTLPIYAEEYIRKHQGRRREDVPPHVFTFADYAYRGMLLNKKNQSMLVTGESGAGKTENTKKIIQYLTGIASTKDSGDISEKLLSTNPLLEAFGNAKTIKNDNSSRFGKFIEINFNSSGYIIGTNIVNYLLETTRTLSQITDERNFHIFYQILSDSATREKYKLETVDRYEIVNKSGCTRIDGVDDKKEFLYTIECMKKIGLNENEIDFVLSTVAGLLHLGNVMFVPNEKDLAQLDDQENSDALKLAAHFFKCKASELQKALIKPKLKVMNDLIETHETPERALFNRNSLLKSIYNRLFNWIVTRVNESLASKEQAKSWIGVLDIAGFEIFTNNSFEQLCINFTNEKLQQFFNHHMFVKEQEEYETQGVEWTHDDFGKDLQNQIDLIEKPGGILNIIEDLNAQRQTDSKRLRELFRKNLEKKNPCFLVNQLDNPNIFNIKHYAGTVPYNTDNWLMKNVDPMNDDCATTLYNSKSKYMQYLFRDAKDIGTKRSNAAFATVSKEYRQQLTALMNKLESTEPHFIRCIIPNRLKKPGILDAQLVIHQLDCNGVHEGLRVARKGYPGRLEFPYFIQRYGLLLGDNELKQYKDNKDKCNAIIKKAGLVQKKEYFTGKSKVFFKVGVETKLERMRDAYVDKIIICVQAASKGYLARQEYKRLIDQVEAVKIIQNNWRAFNQLKSWVWWDLLQASRPQVEFWKQEQERLKQEKEINDLRDQIEAERKAKNAIEEEKRALQSEVMKLTAEVESKSQKISELRQEEDSFKDKNRDLEAIIENYKREKQLAFANKEKLAKTLRAKEEEIRTKEKEIDSLTTQIKEGGNALSLLQNQIRDQTSQKLKLEAQGKRLGEELVDTKNKLSENQSKSSDLEREKNSLDDKIREMNYRMDVIEQEKNNLEKKRLDLDKDQKELEKKLKKAKQDILNFTQTNGQKDAQISSLQSELQELKKKLDETGRQKKQLEILNSELQTNFLEADKKKQDLERGLRETKDDSDELMNKIQKLTTDIGKLEETAKTEGTELADLKGRLQKLTDLKATLEKQRQDLEKELGDVKFALQEAKDKGQREVDAINKKALDVERELNEQINIVVNAKNALDKKIRDQEKSKKDLKKDFEKLESEKANLDSLYKKLEQSLASEQGDLTNEKKKFAELEIQRKDLQTKINDLETKLKEDLEVNQKLDQKRRELQQQADELVEKNALLEKERDDLASEKNENQRLLTQLQLDLTELNNQLSNLQAKADSQDLEVSSLKSRLEDSTGYLNRLKDEAKLQDQKLNELNSALESERNEKASLLRKLAKLEEEIAKLKKKIDEETDTYKKESDARNLIEVELREKRTQLDSETFNRGELEKKVKAAEQKLADLEKLKQEIIDNLTKLKNEEAGLLSTVQALQDEVDEYEHKSSENDGAEKDTREKLNDLEKKKNEQIQIRQKLASENQRIKNEMEIQKELNNQNEKKQEQNLEQMKRKIELSEAEFEQKVKALSNERDELKKELKNLGKREVVGEGKVPKEVLIKLTTEFQSEIDRIRKEVEEERKQKLSQENTKRNLEAQLISFRDQLEQEERQKKKVTLQKKSLQSEIEELKELADEVDDLTADLERLKLDQETHATELKNDIQRERNARQAAEYALIKLEREAQESKKTLEDLKRQDEESLKKLKLDYEAQLEELDQQLEREKKGKKSVSKTSTKSDREIRDLERRLFQVEREKQIAQEKEAGHTKDVTKLREDITEDSKKLSQEEAKNKLLTREVDGMKQKLRDLEEEMAKIRSEALREKQRPKTQKKQKKRVPDSDEEDDE